MNIRTEKKLDISEVFIYDAYLNLIARYSVGNYPDLQRVFNLTGLSLEDLPKYLDRRLFTPEGLLVKTCLITKEYNC